MPTYKNSGTYVIEVETDIAVAKTLVLKGKNLIEDQANEERGKRPAKAIAYALNKLEIV